ncbi:MAG: GerMN domain-containing protein [Actinomycetota bacterium]
MKKTALIVVLLLTLAACGGAEPESASTTPPPDPVESTPAEKAPSPEPTEEATPAPDRSSKELEVWFTYGEHLFVAHHQVETGVAVARSAMEELLARPTGFEANAGVATNVPPGTRLLGLTIEDGIATVDLSEEYGFTGGGTLGESLAVAQVVYTLTQFPTVEGVSFEIEGTPLQETPGHGIDLREPQRRSDWKDFLPPILVTSPTMGEKVTSPVTVEGTADVYEATVQMRLLDVEGNRLDRAFTTATCGTGCRGDFSHDLSFEVDEETHGVIEVWWSSAEDGSRQDVIQIAVTLSP